MSIIISLSCSSQTISNSIFRNNYVSSITSEAKGGAILTTSDLTILSNGFETVFENNYIRTNSTKEYNAIWIDSASATLRFTLSNSGSVLMNDTILGVNGYNIVIDADNNNSMFKLNNNIENEAIQR